MVAKAEFRLGELFPRLSFVVSNLEKTSPAVARFLQRAHNLAGELVRRLIAAGGG